MSGKGDPGSLVGRAMAQRWRFLKFCVVGGSGVFVNLGCVWVGNELLFPSLPEWWRTGLAYLFAIVVSILTNFLANDFWTWADRRGAGVHAFLSRLAKYYAVSAIAAILQYATSMGATALIARLLYGSGQAVVPIHWKWAAVMAGIALGTMVNFLVNHFWTYRLRGQAPPSNHP